MSSIFSSKRADGMSINIVIVAVLALAVLIVLIMIFTGKIKIFGSATASCESRGGTCEKACPIGYVTQMGTDCKARFAAASSGGAPVNGELCCAPFDNVQGAKPAGGK